MTTFSFNDRASYLAYRADWKADYRALSEEIRQTKRLIRNIYAEGRRLPSGEQSDRSYLGLRATKMLEELKEAKIEAGRQRAACREVSDAA